MIIDITSISVLENMYNILTELKKSTEIWRFFPKAGKEGSRALEWCPQKCIFIVGIEEEGIRKQG